MEYAKYCNMQINDMKQWNNMQNIRMRKPISQCNLESWRESNLIMWLFAFKKRNEYPDNS